MKKISLKHLDYLTDDFSIWQHTVGKEIDLKHGYALDDGARALLLAVRLGDEQRAKVYLNFIYEAVGNGKIINFFNKERKPLPKQWSEDALAEAYWALAESIRSGFEPEKCNAVINKIMPKIQKFSSVRGIAYTILGACETDSSLARRYTDFLLNKFMDNSSRDWAWIEDNLSYGNAIIPLSLLKASESLNDPSIQRIGLDMLNFLNRETDLNGMPLVIGNKGWYKKGLKRSKFDQQPIDAGYQVLANIKAWQLTGQQIFMKEAKKYFSWFWGNNLIQQSLIDLNDHSCRDGFSEKKVDINRGAESIICYLLAQDQIWKYLKK